MESIEGLSSLRDAIARAAKPSSDDASDYRIATPVGPAFLARNRSANPVLLIPLPSAPAGVGRRGGGFSLSPLSRVAFEYGGRRWEQAAAAFECTESGLVDAFAVLAADLTRRLALMPSSATWQLVVSWVEEWQSLLARRVPLNAEQQLGLWGELWVISNSQQADLLVAAWRGPDQEATDFFLNGVGLEVKVSRQANVHHISQRQIEEPVGAHKAFVLSLWVGVDPARGISLSDLINSLLTRVSDPPALLRRVAALGYAPIDRDQYPTKWVLLHSPHWFRSEDIPRVRAMDAGISRVRYVAALDVDRSLPAAKVKDLWLHFCGAEPKTMTTPQSL